MARRAGSKRSGIPPGASTFLILALAVLLVAGGAAALVHWLGRDAVETAASDRLRSGHAAYAALQRQRYRQLELIARIFTTEQILSTRLPEAVEAGDLETVLDLVEEYQNILAFDLALVLDRGGRVLTRTDSPGLATEDFSADPLIATALDARQALGVWRERERLYHAVAVPLVHEYELAGYMVVALAVDDALALQVERTSGADVAFLSASATGPAVVASTLGGELGDGLVEALRRDGRVLERVLDRGETLERVEVTLAGEPWAVFLSPLRDAQDGSVGATASVVSLAGTFADQRRTLAGIAALGAAALALGLGLALSEARRRERPLERLAEAASRAADGDVETALPAAGSGSAGRLHAALGRLLRNLREKLALEFSAERAARLLPEPARGHAATGARAGPVALVGVELRRFANPKLSYDPEEGLARLGRDLGRVASAAETHRGRLEAVYGHRALATFEGEGAVQRAFHAATEILLVLSQRESVFDEPEPPAVALAAGPVVSGSVAWGEGPSGVVAGVPVQQLESLLREATPGEIYFSKAVHDELAERFRGAGIEARPRRGLLSPQPLYSADAEGAARVTGVSPPRAGAGSSEEERRFADLKSGMILGSRFELLATLGAGRLGTSFKARDRELGDLVRLKMLEPQVLADPVRFEWLRGAIQRGRMVRHPNLLALLDFGEAEGQPYVASEFARGMSLRYVFDQSRQMPAAAAVRLGRQTAQALAALHAEEILHRALKPTNVLLSESGQVHVMDFALALPIHRGGAVADPEYLAPEQLAGQELDPRADVYALGAVLYEALTGQVPHAGADAEEIRQRQLGGEPRTASAHCSLPASLEQLLARCLARDLAKRPASMGEVLAGLDAVAI